RRLLLTAARRVAHRHLLPSTTPQPLLRALVESLPALDLGPRGGQQAVRVAWVAPVEPSGGEERADRLPAHVRFESSPCGDLALGDAAASAHRDRVPRPPHGLVVHGAITSLGVRAFVSLMRGGRQYGGRNESTTVNSGCSTPNQAA